MTEEELEKVIQHFESLRIIQRESFMRKGFDVAIKALKQEPVIDKIRAEMLEEMLSHSGTGEEVIQAYADGLKKGLDIIDKYRG